MVLASCCGSIQIQTPADLRTWSVVALVCALLLLGEALAVVLVFRRHHPPVWRRKAVILPALAGMLILALAQQAWSTASTLASQEPSALAYAYSGDPADQAWFAQLHGVLYSYSLLGSLAVAATVLLFGGGIAYVLMNRD